MKVIRFKSKWGNIVIIPTACFTKNDTLFYWKWHVVLLKTIRCFSSTDVSFLGWVNVDFRHHKSVCERAVWHLWQQKNKTPVVCAPVRVSVCALAYAWGDFSPSTIQGYNFLFLLLPLCTRPSCELSLFLREKQSLHLSLFLIFEDDENEGERILLCSFLWFFPSFPFYLPIYL